MKQPSSHFDRRRRWAPLSALALVAVLTPNPARAQSSADEAAARALFAEGRNLATAGKYAEACPKFEESLRLTPGVGTELNLADCYEQVGRTASAWARFLSVVSAARSAGQTERAEIASGRAAALEPKLARLRIDVKAPTDALEVLRDGVPIGRASWGVAIPIDPGAHRLEARAPGNKTWSANVTIKAEPGTVTVEVPPLQDVAAPAPGPVALAPSSPARAAPLEPTDGAPPAPGSTQRTIALVLGGVGIVGIGAGTFFGLSASSKKADADEICPNSPPAVCPDVDADRYEGLMDDADQAGTLAIVGFGVGGAALATGAVLYFTARSSSEKSAVRAAPFVVPGAVGGLVRGEW